MEKKEPVHEIKPDETYQIDSSEYDSDEREDIDDEEYDRLVEEGAYLLISTYVQSGVVLTM